MSPNTLKTLQALLVVLVPAVESTHLLPPGVAAACGTLLGFVLGLFHPTPQGK